MISRPLEGVCTIAAAHRKFGTTGLLPTLITDSHEKVRLALETASAAVDRAPGVLGFTSRGLICLPKSRACMTVRHIRRPAADDIAMLTAPRNGVLLVTLAPEVVPPGFHSTADGGRRSRVARSFDGYLPADPCRHGGRADRLHAPFSMPCGRWPAANPDRSHRHWSPPMPGTA